MYKPVPQMQSSNEGEDSESELFNSTLNYDEKSLQYDDHSGEPNPQQMDQPSSMTPIRKVALALSIINCVAFIIIFLWILPCDYDTCKAPTQIKMEDWEVNLTLKGVQAMSMASSPNKRREVLVLLISGTANNTVSTTSCFRNESHNAMGIRAADGKVVWENNFTTPIQYLNCSLIDVNNDGVDDCLLFPAAQSLSAFNSLTGALLWQLKNPQQDSKINDPFKKKILVIDSIADVNNDSIKDLIVILSDSGKRLMLVICGANGELLWQGAINESCYTNDYAASISYIISNSCLKDTRDFGEKYNITGRLQFYGRAIPTHNYPPCQKCEALTNGIPSSQYLIHRGEKDILVRALFNCSSYKGTLLKKNSF